MAIEHTPDTSYFVCFACTLYRNWLCACVCQCVSEYVDKHMPAAFRYFRWYLWCFPCEISKQIPYASFTNREMLPKCFCETCTNLLKSSTISLPSILLVFFYCLLVFSHKAFSYLFSSPVISPFLSEFGIIRIGRLAKRLFAWWLSWWTNRAACTNRRASRSLSGFSIGRTYNQLLGTGAHIHVARVPVQFGRQGRRCWRSQSAASH